MPLPAPKVNARPNVRVLPMAPRSSLAPLIAITCLLAAGLIVGAYFALPYVSEWYKSERVPLQVVEPPARVADSPAAPIGARGTTEAPTKPKKAKHARATKKKAGAAEKSKKPRKQR